MKTVDPNVKLGTMASYGMGKFLGEFITGAYGIMVFYFYESELGLSAGYAALATIIYSLWNAINDPLLGYLTNKYSLFKGRFGRRTPWIIIGLILCIATYICIFTIPANIRSNPVAAFIWMVVTICLYDTVYSLWEVNYQGVFPDKFRSLETRNRTASVATAVGVFGIALGSVLPPLFYEYGDIASFARCAIILAGISLLGVALIIPGVKETPEMIERFRTRKTEENGASFFKALIKSLKYKEFLALVVMLFLYQSACMCMTSSVNYIVDGILGMSSSATTPIFAGMLVGALLSIVLWSKVAKKIRNNQKMLIITCFFMAVASFPMTFIRSQILYAVFMFIWGLGFGGYWTFMSPAMADVVDSIVVKEKRRDDGILMGVRAFFMRLSYVSQALTFWLCHELTGFDASITGQQSPLAQVGISLHMATVPSLFFLAAALVMLSMNNLTPAKVAENKRLLAELNL